MDYLYIKVEDVANELSYAKDPTRRAFAEHLKKVSHALHEIEWVDSGDKSTPDDVNAIRLVFEGDYEKREMNILINDARELIEQLKALGA